MTMNQFRSRDPTCEALTNRERQRSTWIVFASGCQIASCYAFAQPIGRAGSNILYESAGNIVT